MSFKMNAITGNLDLVGSGSSGSNLWTESAGNLYPTTLTDSVYLSHSPTESAPFAVNYPFAYTPTAFTASLVMQSPLTPPSSDSVTFVYGPNDITSGSGSQDLGGSIYTANGQTITATVVAYTNIGGTNYQSNTPYTLSFTDSINDGTTQFSINWSWSGVTNGDGSGVTGYQIVVPAGTQDNGGSTSFDDISGVNGGTSTTPFGGMVSAGQSFNFICYTSGGSYFSDPSSASPYTESYNNGSYFWLSHTISESGTTRIVDTISNKGYDDSSGAFYQTSAFSGDTTVDPKLILSDGSTLNRSYEVYGYEPVSGYYSISNLTSSVSDPNDGNYYYVSLSASGTFGHYKVLRNINSAGYLTGMFNVSSDGSTTPWADGITVTPANSASKVALFENGTNEYYPYSGLNYPQVKLKAPVPQLAFESTDGNSFGMTYNPSTGSVVMVPTNNNASNYDFFSYYVNGILNRIGLETQFNIGNTSFFTFDVKGGGSVEYNVSSSGHQFTGTTTFNSLTGSTPAILNSSKQLNSGSFSGNTTKVATVSGSLTSGHIAKFDAGGNVIDGGVASTGTVTSVATGAGLSGGTITTTGTLTLDLTHANTWTGQQTFSTSAPIFSTMTAGSVLFAGTSGLLSQDNSNFFWDNTNKRLAIGKAGVAPVQPLDIGGPMQFTGVPVAGACSAALAGVGAGNLAPGAYNYRVTFVTAIGETVPTNSSGAVTVVTSAVNGQIALTGIPVSTSPFVTGRNIYRIDPTIPNGIYYKITSGTTISDNTTTTYTDNIANSVVSNLNYGNVTADSSATGIYVSGTSLLHFRGNQNLWFGLGAGNIGVTNLSSLNVGIGSGVLGSITTGSSNVGAGANATLGSLTTGTLSTAVGSNVLRAMVSSSENSGFGQSAGAKATGNYGTYVGSYAGLNLVGGDFNVALGRGSLGNAASGSNNTAIGSGAGGANANSGQTNWTNMLLFGYNAGANINQNSISNVTVIGGNSIYAESATASNTLNIMNAIYGTTMDGTTSTDSTGNIGLFTKSPTARLHLPAGATGASKAPLKFTTGTNQTTAEAGAMEYDGTDLYFTRAGTVRENVLVAIDNVTAPSTSATPVMTTYYGGNTNQLGDPNRWISVNILGSTYKIPLYT